MRVFAWIKLMVCLAMIAVSGYFAFTQQHQDPLVTLVISGYFFLEMLPTLMYLRKRQKLDHTLYSEILDSPDQKTIRMSIFYKFFALLLSAIILVTTFNLSLVYNNERIVMQNAHYTDSEIFHQSTKPLLFVIALTLLNVSFNILSAFRKIKPKRAL